LIVTDEAHYVKNPRAQRTRALQRLMQHAERTAFMTGTPLENLWAMYEAAQEFGTY